jgi:enoyl-CoA hydratase
MNYPRYEQLRLERQGAALWITMDNAPLNSVSSTMHAELADLLNDVNRDENTRVVVLTGAGDSFSAGGDINDMQSKRADTRHHMRMLADGARIVRGLLGINKPIVARINGHAIGLGATLALFCDITIAANHVKIGDPHVRIGLAAGDGGALIWPLLIGYARAKEYLLTGKPLSATRAADIGLINYAVPPAELDGKVQEFVEWFSNGPANAIGLTKQAINQVLLHQSATIVESHLGLEVRSIFSDEHDEAVSAFLEKRSPNFASGIADP